MQSQHTSIHLPEYEEVQSISAQTGVVGIELELLKKIVRYVVSEELSKAASHIIDALKPSDIKLTDGATYSTNQVASILGVTRNTVRNYRKEGILAEPALNLSGRPVWTSEQIIGASRKKGIVTKFDV
jgi:hypothetical protein